MKVFLNSNFEIENISNESGDPIVRGSDKFNKLHIFVPTSTVNSYNTISPLYSVKRADGRILGNYATITTHDNTEAFNGYYGWKGDFNPRDIAVAGALELTISFKMKKTAASVEMTKVVAKITLEVKDAAVVLDDVLVLSDGNAWISLSDSIAALTTNLGAKADLNNNQQSIVAGLVKSTSFKKGDAELATETQVSEEATARQQADNALQTDINTRVKIADIINALNDTSTNKPLSAYQGKLLKDAIDSINTLLQSDDTNLDELQEIVTYIKNNKSLIDGITSSKISFTDIVDNLTSEVANKPLSAKQGYILKGLIDTLQTAVNNRYTKSETDSLLDGKADKSTTYTKTQVDGLLDDKQDITIPAITIAGVEYTNLEAAISAINDYAETIEQVIGSISGTDTTIATRLTQLESSVQSLNTAWTTFTTGTSADNIINTLVEIQQELAKFNIITIDSQNSSITQAQYDSINEHTILVKNDLYYTYLRKGTSGSANAGYHYFFAFDGNKLSIITIKSNLQVASGNTTLENAANKRTTWSSSPDNIHYPGEKLVKDSLDSETSRATSQENKSLYHLGAFDTISGNTITRQTGYYVFKDFSSPYWTPTDNTYGFYFELPNYDVSVDNAIANVPNKTGDSAWGSQTACFDPTKPRIYCPRDYKTPIIIQYKLTTSYTENVIENRSILPLDSNMAQMIRQDVVDSLNLFNPNAIVREDGFYNNSGNWVSNTDYNEWCFYLKAGTYTISATEIYVGVCIMNSSYVWQSQIVGLTTTSPQTFTITSDSYVGISIQKARVGTSAMLNKGSHAYPPSDYHASKHITDEEATLLKEGVGYTHLLTFEGILDNGGANETYITSRLTALVKTKTSFTNQTLLDYIRNYGTTAPIITDETNGIDKVCNELYYDSTLNKWLVCYGYDNGANDYSTFEITNIYREKVIL